MAESDDTRKGWFVSINGTAGEPEGDKITIRRHDPPRVVLEIDAPGIRSAGEDQRQQGREAIREVLAALQEALDSPSGLGGFRPD